MPPPDGSDAAGDDDGAWGILPHACRTCLGRIVLRGDTFRCADCDATTAGAPDGICGCGLRLAAGPPRLLRCVPNPASMPACRAEIVIAFGEGKPRASS